MTLNRNLTDFHTEMEQAAFEPNNLVPGIGLSPDKMLLARGFSYADAHRARLGVNYKQIPVNAPKAPVHSYSKDGVGRTVNVDRPRLRAQLLRRPGGGPVADRRGGAVGGRRRDGPVGVRAAARRRRLRPGRHDGARGARRRCPRAARVQRRRAPVGRRLATTCWHARSSTGRTSTRRSASASSRPSERPSAHSRCRGGRARTGSGRARRLRSNPFAGDARRGDRRVLWPKVTRAAVGPDPQRAAPPHRQARAAAHRRRAPVASCDETCGIDRPSGASARRVIQPSGAAMCAIRHLSGARERDVPDRAQLAGVAFKRVLLPDPPASRFAVGLIGGARWQTLRRWPRVASAPLLGSRCSSPRAGGVPAAGSRCVPVGTPIMSSR